MKTLIKASGPMYAPNMIYDEYLKSYDPEANDGRGDATFTRNPTEAKVFDSLDKALECAFSQPKNRLFRFDGQPNCPLRAFHLEFVVAEQAWPLQAQEAASHKLRQG